MIKKAVITALEDKDKYLAEINQNSYVIDSLIKILIKSGITDILIILSKKNYKDIIDHLGQGCEYEINISYKIQENISVKNSLNLSKSFTGKDSFIITKANNFFENSFEKELNNFLYKSYIFIKNSSIVDLYIYTNHVYEVAKLFNDLNFSDINEYYCNKKDCGIHKIDGLWIEY